MKDDKVFLKKWKEELIEKIQLVYPKMDEDKIESILDKEIDKKLSNPECVIDNNYLHQQARTTVLDLYEYIDRTKPIIAGGGVLFKNQHQAINPPSFFLDGSLKARKAIKKGLKTAIPGSYEYKTIDNKQLTEKVVANSYYGASGASSSPFYNIYTASATTATGQALISTMMTAFESFYANNVLFYDVGDFLLYVNNSLNKEEIKDWIEIHDMPKISNSQLRDKFFNMFYDKKQLNPNVIDIIEKTIDNLDDGDKQIVFYSSNLFEFIKIRSIQKVIKRIITGVETFKNPNEVPKEIKDDLDYLWMLLHCWVVYNYPTFNRVNRLKFDKRKVVVTIDTDSNMLCIDRWMKFLDTFIQLEDTILGDPNEYMYIKCNTLCYILTKYSQVVLKKYCDIANIPEDYAPNLNMKNEFLYLRMILSNKKKSYCGLVRLREGNEIIPEKLDIKGMQFIKSTAAPETKAYFQQLTRKTLYAKNISGSSVLSDVKNFARYIENSLSSGEKKFLNPLSVKEPEAYKAPMSNQGIRGTIIWNLLYPDKAIELPEKLTVAKLKLNTQKNLQELSMRYPEIYKKLYEGILDNPECSFRDKGITVIAIPSQVTEVPEWITNFIDKEKIINDNITKYHMVMESLGVKLLDTRSNNATLTNIIKF